MRRSALRYTSGLALVIGLVAILSLSPRTRAQAQAGLDIEVPPGYEISEFAAGLTQPIAMTFAPNGDLYVLNSGFPGFEQGAPLRAIEIVKVTPEGQMSLVYTNGGPQGATTGPSVQGTGGVTPAGGAGLQGVALGIAVLDDDTIFVNDSRGLNRVRRDGSVELLAALPAQMDHNANHIRIKGDKLYWGEGSATNSGIVGSDNQSVGGWLKAHPDLHDIPCRDVTLTGKNYEDKDQFAILGTKDAIVETGPYLPYGTKATAGQVIRGQVPCTSAILRSNLDGSNIEMVAWGFRNPFSLAFSPESSPLGGALVVVNNGADVRGSRPIESDSDDLYIIKEGGWYGWPDYLDELPVTEARFAPGSAPKRGVDLLLQSPGREEAIGAVSHFEKGVSADGLDFSTSEAFGHVNDVFVALWGPLLFGAQAQDRNLPGYDVHRVQFIVDGNGLVTGTTNSVFARNRIAGRASQTGQNGFEHPIDVKFSPDGTTMFVLDFGIDQVGGGRIFAIRRQAGAAAAPSTSAAPPPAEPAAAPGATAQPAPAAIPAPSPSGGAAVTLQGFAFAPKTLTVAPGTTVVWTNEDEVAHTVTADDGTFDSGLLQRGDTFSWTFTTPGTYGYYCIPHGSPGSGMFGTIVVSQP